MTQYYVQIASDLVEEIQKDDSRLPSGFMLVSRWGPKSVYSERWIVEDEDAGNEYEDHFVEVSFRRNYITEEVTVVDRQIVNPPSF